MAGEKHMMAKCHTKSVLQRMRGVGKKETLSRDKVVRRGLGEKKEGWLRGEQKGVKN